MKSKTTLLGTVAIALFAAVSASPAQALIVGGNPNYSPLDSLPTTLTVAGEFNNGDLTGGFTSVSNILVNSVNIKAGSLTPGFNASYDATPNFLSNFTYGGVDAVLNLLAGDRVFHTFFTVSPFTSTSTVDFELIGEIRSAVNGQLLGTAVGGFSAGKSFRGGSPVSSNFSLDISATPIPTPALLPGLIGLGVSVLRKRKKETAATRAEV